jgi:hypothetical protein
LLNTRFSKAKKPIEFAMTIWAAVGALSLILQNCYFLANLTKTTPSWAWQLAARKTLRFSKKLNPFN